MHHHFETSLGFQKHQSHENAKKKERERLTGSSSLCVHTPLYCLCSITCLMFMSTGRAIQPDAKLSEDKSKIHNTLIHLALRYQIIRKPHIQGRRASNIMSDLTLSGDSTESPSNAQASRVKMLQISAH